MKIENDLEELNYKNEDEIKKNIEIKINGEKIDFMYKYNFNKEGKYKIEYSFASNLTKMDFIFYQCDHLTNIDVSNYHFENVTNVRYMFSECISLNYINY